jgi:hypothetical protein
MMSAANVAKEMGCTPPIATALLTSQILPSRMVVHPTNGVELRMTTRERFEDFAAKYVSVHGIAVESGKHHRNVGRLMREMGIAPAFDPRATRTPFFERSRIRDALERLRA